MSQPMILEPPSDAELMALVQEGDREAFAELVDRHQDAVVGYLARLTADRDRAEDYAQETFLRLFRAAGEYVEQGYLRAFLFRIATNLVRSEERRAQRLRLLMPFLPREPHAEPAAASGLLRSELHRAVAAALAKLSLRYRVPLVLHEIEGWTYVDIAQELGCREGTVKSRVHRGRQQLKKRLEPYWNGDASWKTTG
ncbi:MAG TPA: sigma-70 family RNA polymerase sigma factor [Thermoanaerobaculia bacterium]|jgi:RNA polymerase sigma-70 factor (ECF subfamily)|nr:sigma-70 family RNA polymerase sigma factor [Thermoanaerobaculia bacterium]